MYDADPRQGSLGEVDAGWFGTDEGTLPLGAPFRPGLDPLPARPARVGGGEGSLGTARRTASRAPRCDA